MFNLSIVETITSVDKVQSNTSLVIDLIDSTVGRWRQVKQAQLSPTITVISSRENSSSWKIAHTRVHLGIVDTLTVSNRGDIRRERRSSGETINTMIGAKHLLLVTSRDLYGRELFFSIITINHSIR